MTHTDDLRERVTELADRLALNTSDHERGGITTAEYLSAARETADRIIAAVHASIAARALSDEVVEAVQAARNGDAIWNFEETMVVQGDEGSDEDIIAALLLALGITESETTDER